MNNDMVVQRLESLSTNAVKVAKTTPAKTAPRVMAMNILPILPNTLPIPGFLGCSGDFGFTQNWKYARELIVPIRINRALAILTMKSATLLT
jgi:hypothetical protein